MHQAEERAQFEMLKSQMYAERAAKRDRKPKKARAVPEELPKIKGWWMNLIGLKLAVCFQVIFLLSII